ncbi:ABA4-like family protein [Thermaurantiacus sp.]|uniref:ABA4-like family protein n=1 Tax=Thermaurantiacus sp. TaxID=2820283 RepID=UPI0039A2AC9D
MANAELLFGLANLFAMAGWACLAVAVFRVRRAGLVAAARVAAALVAGLYVAILVRGLAVGPGLPEGAGFATLRGVEALFGQPGAILGAWVHLLAFDLWAGAWAAEDAGRRDLPAVPMLGCLALTLMAGPAGLLVYLLWASLRPGRPGAGSGNRTRAFSMGG